MTIVAMLCFSSLFSLSEMRVSSPGETIDAKRTGNFASGGSLFKGQSLVCSTLPYHCSTKISVLMDVSLLALLAT